MELYILYALTFACSLLMGSLLMPKIISISYKKKLMDQPDQRKVHSTPVPRLGGFCFLPLAVMCLFLFNALCVVSLDVQVTSTDTTTFLRMQAMGVGAMLLFLIGLADDLVGIGYKCKFAAQIIAASCLPLSGLWINKLGGFLGIYDIPPVIGVPLTVFAVVYVINAVNLIDGIDGLASGVCILSLSLYAAMFIFLERPVFVAMCLSILGVLMVFFFFNVFGGRGRVRKVFMGDCGSLTLGYFISYLLVYVSTFHCGRLFVRSGALWPALGALVIPLLDILRVVFARYRDRVPLFLPDKRHIHHKLMRTGLSPHATMVVLLLLTLWFIGINSLLAQYVSGTWIVVADLLSWTVMHLIINRYITRASLRNPELVTRFENPKNTIPENKNVQL
ncbi:MAG: undecaprenyl/decaprenyl-phosphate alpha-N-acetylglucosaminyl 1-phosphate transferase [Clostridium sp.]|nr:undecaprenyl/decaprenyl-phosphate alpha-N-acetylglucosaminyl 1-phosphate transferase [Clostridium sp.]